MLQLMSEPDESTAHTVKPPPNNYPKLHNAMWPGLVGKGAPGGEPCIDLDTMLDLTAKAEVNGVKFDGVDLFLYDPHVNINASDDDLDKLAEKISSRGFFVGSVVAPGWPGTGGGSAMGSEEERAKFVGQVRKACRIALRLRSNGIRPDGIVRVDSACNVVEWGRNPRNNTKLIADTFKECAKIARDHGERLGAEGEICWGGMHSWKYMAELLGEVGESVTVGFQADQAHTLLYILGYNSPHRIVPPDFRWEPAAFHEAMTELTKTLRPWMNDFHVAQNDATVKGSGSHDKTGRHCLPTDVNGKLNIPRDAGYWLRDENGKVTRKCRTICWDGCMFPNAVMMQPQTWNDILATMIQVRDNHGWYEEVKA